jgi:lactoylglutathione lyase
MPTITGINHVAIQVIDVPKSIDFYSRVMGLSPLPRPAFDFDGAWFALGQSQQLHLLGHRQDPVYAHSRGNHFALEITDLDAWEVHLAQTNATYRPPKTRPDGVRQIFITDPDGHCIELTEIV